MSLHSLLGMLKEQLQKRSKFIQLKAQKTLKNKKKLAFFLLSNIGLILVAYYLANTLVISTGDSIDKHVFIKTDKTPEYGDYVIISGLNDPIVKETLITKKIVCQGGQILKMVVDDYFCDGEYIGKSVRKTKEGIPVEPYNPCITEEKRHSPFEFYRKDVVNTKICEYKIPDGYYFVAGSHPRSYDSRYFGLITKENILNVVVPLW